VHARDLARDSLPPVRFTKPQLAFMRPPCASARAPYQETRPMIIRRSLSLSLLLAVVAAPAVIGCASATSPDDAEGAAAEGSSALAKSIDGPVDPSDPVGAGKTVGPKVPVGPTYTNDVTPAFVEAAPTDPNAPAVQQTSNGAGWRVLHVAGNLPDAKTGALTAVDDDIIVLESKEAIDAAPLGPKTRAQLKASSTLRAKKQIAAVAPVAATTPTAASAAAAFNVTDLTAVDLAPQPDEALFTVVRKKAMDQLESPPPGVSFFSICDDYDSSFTKSMSVDKSYSYHKGDETGSFTGSFDVNARVQGNASATINYHAETSVFAGCNAVWVDFKKATVQGTADVTAGGKVDAQFQKQWHYSKTIAQPTVLDQWFTIGVVPVHLRLMVPVEAGLDAEAKATLHANAKVVGHGSFNMSCTSSSCSGSKSAYINIDSNDPPSFEATARVKVTPWVQGSLKAVLFDETIGGYGQVGLRASLPVDLWAYAGNQCGDADGHDGPELVTGATLDMAVKVDVVAKAGAFGATAGPWSWNVANEHLYFHSFGDGTVLDPIVTSELTSNLLETKMHGRMRPCWPYTDAVTYRVTWSDGAVSTVTGSPTALFTQDHIFSSYGIKPIAVEPLHDAAGRDLSGHTTTRRVWLSPLRGIEVANIGDVQLAAAQP
jgi:hypothetical protein